MGALSRRLCVKVQKNREFQGKNFPSLDDARKDVGQKERKST